MVHWTEMLHYGTELACCMKAWHWRHTRSILLLRNFDSLQLTNV